MNANDIEQIILDLPPESAAEIIWDILQDTAFSLDEAETGLAYYKMKVKALEGIPVSAESMSAAWNKYWGIKKGNAQRRSYVSHVRLRKSHITSGEFSGLHD